MAVAGLHNVSAYDSAFLREARSPASRLWGEPERPNTRASSVLQMWRELEGEHVVSHPNMRLEELPRPLGSETSGSGRLSSQGSLNGDGFLENVVQGDNETVSYPQSLVDSDNEHEDDNSFCSEQSTDLGETERDRVRQVFREWMRSGGGVKNHSPNASLRNNRSRSPLLGQNERERVRVIREWMQINSQHRGSHGSLRDESISEIGSQIEQVRDGQLVSHREVAERRPLRKLCGRQALLDMLVRAQRERKEEILKLLQHRPVSDFAHRNRIQTLLKGRFLLNQRLARDERPACTAVNELGLLRQRHAVSDLRDGFLSRLDQQPSQNVYLSNGQPQSNNDLDDEDETDLHSEYGNSQTENVGIHNSQDNTIQDLNRQENIAVETEAEVQILRNINREDETSSIELARGGHSREDNTIGNYWPENSPEETEQVSNALETVPTHLLHNANIPQNFDAGELIPGAVETVHTYLLESHPIYNDDSPQNVYASEGHGAAGNMYSMAEELPLQGILAHVEELQESESELEEYDLQSSVREISEWTEVNIEENTLQETGSQRYHEPANGDVMEQTQLQESDEEWSGNVLQEAISSWLDVPSGQETGSVGRDNSFYFPDEEDIQSTELRQLLGRRRVSTLLRSGFRESLDQLIQSYVQRQNDASAEWDLDEESSSHASVEQGQEPQHHNQDPDQEARWGHELQDDDWPDLSPLRHTQNKWEMINELRIDMAGLQQKMNNMQNMLEACMDLQLELQRSVRQEVSAALNRPFNSSADNAEITVDDSRWDRVRKGICCMCSDSHIDTLLYRCGHMCTCSKCADELVQGGKCPMCYAPVIEVVRAYFIQ
ncbi:hypothetical protein LIER_07980 [Lithospermum erythrorhizon]|uniref:RING-type domain-containing protein n=1 Tax=Lithospermum erythrorhizon TaxID=34254 RepID=A0AAV3PAJ9_LITER